jgi:hypothetical protein
MAGYNSITAQPAGHVTTAGEWANMVQIMANAMEIYPVRKTSDESLAANTTLQTDDELFVSVGASKVYMIRAILIYEAVQASGGIKFAFSFPSLATMTWGQIAAVNGTAGQTNTTTLAFGSATSGTSNFAAGGNGAGNQMLAVIEGVLATSTNAGLLQLLWAQQTSNATAAVMKTNSTLTATRIA